MSTPEQPETPQLTRKQMRDIRNTGATPIIDVTAAPVITADEVPTGDPVDETPVGPPPIEESLPAVRRPPHSSREPPNPCCCPNLRARIEASTSASHR